MKYSYLNITPTRRWRPLAHELNCNCIASIAYIFKGRFLAFHDYLYEFGEPYKKNYSSVTTTRHVGMNEFCAYGYS